MLSRVANNVYWTSRYLERAENTARIVNVHGNMLLDLPSRLGVGWEPLLAITGSDEQFYKHYRNPDERNVVKFLLTDARNSGSILSSLAYARENLRTTRDIIPRESWEAVNDLHRYAQHCAEEGITKRNRYEATKYFMRQIQQICGFLDGAMTRDIAYSFVRLGRYLERADMTSRVLDVRAANLLPPSDRSDEVSQDPLVNTQWMSVLKSVTAYQMYRLHMRLRVTGPDVLKFLLQNREFPRAFSFCMDQLEGELNGLPRPETALRRVARLQRRIQSADVRALAERGLHEFIDELQISLGELHGDLDNLYFRVAPLAEAVED